MILAVTVTQAVAGVIVAIPSLILAYLGYKRSQKVDDLAAAAGVAQTSAVTTGQVLDSLDKIVQRLGEDNVQLRSQLAACTERTDALDTLISKLRSEVVTLMRRVNGG